uniref:Uncharacterized protein n=1 Tax=viral metagenome TaxID=1070528 RepID=A0A6C0LPI4_9ZZZZ
MNIIYTLLCLLLVNTMNIHSYIKFTFQNQKNSFINVTKIKNILQFIEDLHSSRKSNTVRLPAILEIPVDDVETWEDGEIPWELNDTTIKKVLPHEKNPMLDGPNIAFLFI